MNTKHVVVVPYDEAWPAEFAGIRGALEAALAGCGCGVEHVGSTSVPGLCAKPIIDIDIIIPDAASFPAVAERLAASGYRYEGDLGIPGREAFRYTGTQPFMKHHLYMCVRGSAELTRHIALRDWLRAHPEDAAEYGRVKQRAARNHPYDVDAYIEEKGPFIRGIYGKCGLP
ncbi:MAG TPA: GrpB family protein [Candidatus Limnocylindria bacterium]|nr:GrpB family protein [Candidatus Limnocylindria bacterium]